MKEKVSRQVPVASGPIKLASGVNNLTLYTSADQINSIAKKYFASKKHFKKPYTITGLAIALGATRQEMMTFIKESTQFEIVTAIKHAISICEDYAEERVFSTTPTGAIFALKNYGWQDAQSPSTLINNININEVIKREDLKNVLSNLYSPFRQQQIHSPIDSVRKTASLRPSLAKRE